jgi:hypothetical protein
MPSGFVSPTRHNVATMYGPNLTIEPPPGSQEPEKLYTPQKEVTMTPQNDGTAHVQYRTNIALEDGTYVNSPPAVGHGTKLQKW